MLHTFVALVQDKPGVLTRVASLFRRLNINIVSLTVGESERADTSRMTIVCEAPSTPRTASAPRSTSSKPPSTSTRSTAPKPSSASSASSRSPPAPTQPHGLHSRSQIFELAKVFRARVVDLAPESIMMEMTGSASKIEGLLQVLRESGYTILEVSRTGRMAMRRGHHTSRVLKALGTNRRRRETQPPRPRLPDALTRRATTKTTSHRIRRTTTLIHSNCN